MKTSTVLMLGLTALTPVAAGAQTIRGVAREDPGGMVVAGASVSVLRLDGSVAGGARTDSVGGFQVALAAPGRFLVRVTHPSYLTVQSDTVEVGEDDVLTVELHLGRDAIPLKPLVVTARVDRWLADFRERARKGSGFGRYVTRADIDRRPGLSATELLRGVAGVRIVSQAPCPGCADLNVLYLRGGIRPCVPTVLIDGMRVKQDALSPLDATLDPATLEGVEVYVEPAGVPPSLGIPSTSCGLVAFWTRPPEGGTLTWKRLGVAAAILVVLFLLVR